MRNGKQSLLTRKKSNCILICKGATNPIMNQMFLNFNRFVSQKSDNKSDLANFLRNIVNEL